MGILCVFLADIWMKGWSDLHNFKLAAGIDLKEIQTTIQLWNNNKKKINNSIVCVVYLFGITFSRVHFSHNNLIQSAITRTLTILSVYRDYLVSLYYAVYIYIYLPMATNCSRAITIQWTWTTFCWLIRGDC